MLGAKGVTVVSLNDEINWFLFEFISYLFAVSVDRFLAAILLRLTF